MGEQMTFPNTWEEYEEFYGFTDSERVYTNGARLIPSFRVEQWLEHKNVRSEWVKYDEGDCVCLHCGFVLDDWTQAIFYNYCPNCGADMRGE